MAHPLRKTVPMFVELFIIHCFVIQVHGVVPSNDDIPIKNCSSTLKSGNQSHPSSKAFNDNRNTLFSTLTSSAARFKFYNASVGKNSGYPDVDTVYGQFMCLNFRSIKSCHNCVLKAKEDIAVNCPETSEAIIWEEFCQLRISHEDIFGKLGPLQMNQAQQNPSPFRDPDKLRLVVNETLNYLAERTAYSLVNDSSASKEVKLGLNMNDTLYSFMQCAEDLSKEDCLACLRRAIADVRECCNSSLGARLLSPSCYLRYELYPFYDNDSDPGDGANKWMTMFLPIVIACLSLALVSSAVWFAITKCREDIDKEQGRPIYPHKLFTRFTDSPTYRGPFFDLGSILAATDNYSEKLKLGEGGFGPVYKGVLRDGTEVAVKRLQEIFSEQGEEEFRNEVMLIMKLQHNNLVRLLGFWAGGAERLLVYEYMPNRSLDVFLFDPRRRMRLGWSRRLNIITGIARGTLYLHEDSRERIIHRDIKASNILLDADMNPKISDFGIARIFAGAEAAANTTTIIGTYGYMSPEYAMEGLYSVKSDVYSFGVLLLEIVTGRRNAGFSSSKLAPSLPAYAWQMWNRGKPLDLMDSLLHGSCPPEEFIRCVHVGLLCVQEDTLDRPTMSSVLVMLKKDSVILHQPQRPAFSVRCFDGNFVSAGTNGSKSSINGLTISNVMPW